MTDSTLVVAADLIVRFKQGKLWIHSAAQPDRAVSQDNADLVDLLIRFARPARTANVIGSYPAQVRDVVASCVATLREGGMLVEAGSQPPAGEAAARGAWTVDKRIADMADALYDLASDLKALGPHADRALAATTGMDTVSRVGALFAGVEGLSSELRAVRDDYMTTQLRALGVDAQARNLKLHVGAGDHPLEGWVNIDVHPAPLAMNIKWGLPFADGSAERVFLSHLLEHLFYPREVLPVLRDIHRVLAPGGVVRIIVPDVEQCLRAYVAEDDSFFTARRETWTWWPPFQTRLTDFLAYSGAGPSPGMLFESHKFGYDFDTLAFALGKAGFEEVRRCGYMTSPHEDLRVDDASMVAGATFSDRHYSLFVEATRQG